MQSVLITGGAGFIGSHLVESLISQGTQEIIVVDNLSSGHRENIPTAPNISFVHEDIRNTALVNRLVAKCDIVFHLAEYIPETREYGPGHVVKFSSEKPLEDFEVNAKGTLVVLDAARKHDRKVIFTSTAAVYGNTGLQSIPEDTKPLPASPYGAAKLCAEIYGDIYSREFRLPIVVARLFNVYGPRQRKYVMYDLLLRLLENSTQLDVLGTGKEERDFIYVQDAVDALMMLASDPEAEGQVFNVGTGVATQVSTVVRLLLKILKLNIKVRFIGESWSGDVKAIVANIDRLTDVGFKPKFSLEKGVEKLVAWFLASNSIPRV